jgi:hypothetical protein
MSLTKIRPYFRERLESLGFSEHKDGFNLENIPKTIINRTFHILVSSISGGPINHTHQNTVSTVELVLFFSGFRDVGESLDNAIDDVEKIVKDVCKVSNRTKTLLNVVFNAVDFAPLNEQNDNSVAVRMEFSAEVILCVENE